MSDIDVIYWVLVNTITLLHVPYFFFHMASPLFMKKVQIQGVTLNAKDACQICPNIASDSWNFHISSSYCIKWVSTNSRRWCIYKEGELPMSSTVSTTTFSEQVCVQRKGNERRIPISPLWGFHVSAPLGMILYCRLKNYVQFYLQTCRYKYRPII